MRIGDVLTHDLFARARLRAGASRLDREVAWVHVVDQPDPAKWVRPRQLVLTTGHALTGSVARQRAALTALAERDIAGLVLAVPSYFDSFPDVMVELGDDLGLPLVELPWEVPFVDVTEAIHRQILGEQYRVLEASERVHRELTRAAVGFKGLPDLAETLGQLLRRAIVVEADDGTLLGTYREPESEDATRVDTLARGRRSPEYVAYVRKLGMHQALHQVTGPLRIPGSPDGRIAARVVCPVRLAQERVAYVWIVEGRTPLSELDLRAAEHAATVAALHLAHQRELARTEHRLGASLLDTLIELKAEPEPALLERARLAGLRDEAPWQLVLTALDLPLPLSASDLRARDGLAQRWLGQLLDEGSCSLVTTHLDHVIALTPAATDVASVARTYAVDRYRVLVSDPGTCITDVRSRYRDLLGMLPHVAEAGVHAHSDYLLPRVLAGDRAAHYELRHRMLGPLERASGGPALRETLAALCRTGFHLNASSEALGVHISTLRYRLDRLRDVLGHDLADPETRFLLQLCHTLERYEPSKT